jgi:FkbM family methyltransferase
MKNINMENKWKFKGSDPVDGRAEFENISEFKQYARVELFDVTTQTIMHQDTQYWENGITYWITPGPAANFGGETVLRIFNKEGDCELEQYYSHYGQCRIPVVNGKPIYFKSNKEDITYQTLKEVFWTLDYQKDYCKIDVNDVVVDIGGNIGVFAVYAQQFKPKHTYVLEPMKETFNYLNENLKGFDNITTIEKAISKRGGDMELIITKHSGCNMLKSHNGINEVFGDEEIVSVKTTNINDFIEEHDIKQIDFLKIDCEGGELDLFQTINLEYLKNNVKKIALEYHSPEIYTFIRDTLQDCGFTFEDKSDKRLGPNKIGYIYAYKKDKIKL